VVDIIFANNGRNSQFQFKLFFFYAAFSPSWYFKEDHRPLLDWNSWPVDNFPPLVPLHHITFNFNFNLNLWCGFHPWFNAKVLVSTEIERIGKWNQWVCSLYSLIKPQIPPFNWFSIISHLKPHVTDYSKFIEMISFLRDWKYTFA